MMQWGIVERHPCTINSSDDCTGQGWSEMFRCMWRNSTFVRTAHRASLRPKSTGASYMYDRTCHPRDLSRTTCMVGAHRGP